MPVTAHPSFPALIDALDASPASRWAAFMITNGGRRRQQYAITSPLGAMKMIMKSTCPDKIEFVKIA